VGYLGPKASIGWILSLSCRGYRFLCNTRVHLEAQAVYAALDSVALGVCSEVGSTVMGSVLGSMTKSYAMLSLLQSG
jgi:hypothetical protein